MKLIGFNFQKIEAERKKEVLSNVRITTNIEILSIEKTKADILSIKEDLFNIQFRYSLNYEPDTAKIILEGNLVLIVDSVLSKEITEEWKKKKIPSGFNVTLLNLILRKAGIKAVSIEEDLGLPTHIPFPSLKEKEQPNK